ncbi:protein ORD-like isoform X2 [Drosophila sulfurigaster albostrigata]|uniref:protein ORD-like isoform X2 n=1 Tax=Drosophila sulfurigaster albostrigata TaxID=89887 RepID=UPI002D21A756|nr:protein ORD-like isoform X2 [Drosophila sulfurigaster albostrigata]
MSGVPTMRISTITIEDCLGCKKEHIKFPANDSVHLLLYKAGNQIRSGCLSTMAITPVVQAFKLMCTKEYATTASLQNLPQLQVGKGCVKMTLSLSHSNHSDVYLEDLDMGPSTSRQAFERQQLRLELENLKNSFERYEVSVVRRFDDVRTLDRVMIQINSGVWSEQTIIEFCDFFFVQPQHLPKVLVDAYKMNPTNWIKIIRGDTDSYRHFREKGNPFETFAKLFHHEDYERNELLEQLASTCLFNREAIRLSERRFLMTVFDDVRKIFEYITCDEYSLYFFVPRLNCYTPLHGVNINDFDLSNVRTIIKLTGDASALFWDHTDQNIMDILHVSFQLALATLGTQTVIFLTHLEKVSKISAANFMNKMNVDNEYSTQWACQRYLHRIIAVAEKFNILVFIEFPVDLTLLPEPRNVIKCVEHYDINTKSVFWYLSVHVPKNTESQIRNFSKLMGFN